MACLGSTGIGRSHSVPRQACPRAAVSPTLVSHNAPDAEPEGGGWADQQGELVCLQPRARHGDAPSGKGIPHGRPGRHGLGCATGVAADSVLATSQASGCHVTTRSAPSPPACLRQRSDHGLHRPSSPCLVEPPWCVAQLANAGDICTRPASGCTPHPRLVRLAAPHPVRTVAHPSRSRFALASRSGPPPGGWTAQQP